MSKCDYCSEEKPDSEFNIRQCRSIRSGYYCRDCETSAERLAVKAEEDRIERKSYKIISRV